MIRHSLCVTQKDKESWTVSNRWWNIVSDSWRPSFRNKWEYNPETAKTVQVCGCRSSSESPIVSLKENKVQFLRLVQCKSNIHANNIAKSSWRREYCINAYWSGTLIFVLRPGSKAVEWFLVLFGKVRLRSLIESAPNSWNERKFFLQIIILAYAENWKIPSVACDFVRHVARSNFWMFQFGFRRGMMK